MRRTESHVKMMEPIPFTGEQGNTRTLAVVAQLLGAEGFNSYVAAQVESYEAKRVMSEREIETFAELREGLSEIMRTLTPEQTNTVGRFISYKEKMAFDAGLKIGLLKHVHDCCCGE
jgi:hypothetical protein